MKKNAENFDTISRTVFAPIYPVIAEDILERTQVREGLCVDIGAGTGRLGLAVADKNSDIDVILYDMSEEMLEIAEFDIPPQHYDRCSTMVGDVERFLFKDNTLSLAVSRGSVFFWENKVQGFNEIYRALKPGGWAYIGGGFGNVYLLQSIVETMRRVRPKWDQVRQERLRTYNKDFFERMMADTIVPNYEVNSEEAGIWVVFQK
jgi:ubiquinone/menaquinone biosynthesis C-methylase UbiE